jgi:hypothetical protein
MTAFCGRALSWLTASFLLAGLAARALAAEPISVTVDQATVLKLPDRAVTVVIGDPLIADLSIQPGGLAVVTGKSYGGTNVIVLDKSGAVLMETNVEVTQATDPTVVVYRGVVQNTYSCTPLCAPRLTLGDDPDSFTKVLNQTTTRNVAAMALGSVAPH